MNGHYKLFAVRYKSLNDAENIRDILLKCKCF